MNQKRILTWILLGAGGAFVIFAGLLAYVAMTFDVNDYKDRFSKEVAQRYQRNLTIDGELSLSVFPNVEITLPHTSLSEVNNKNIAAEVKEARVAIALMPLIRKEVQIGEIVLDGLKAVVTKDKAGKSNFDDLFGSTQKAESSKKSEPSSPQRQTINFDVDGIRITNSAFTYRDLGTGKEMDLTQVNMNVGRLAAQSAVPLELSFFCESKNPSVKAKLTMSGNILLDQTNKRYGTDALSLTFDGTVENAPLSYQLDLEDLEWAATAFKAKSFKVIAKRDGPESGEIRLALSGATGSPSSINVDQFSAAIETTTAATGRKTTLDFKSPLTANLDNRSLSVKELDGRVKIDDPASAVKVIELTMNGALDANIKDEKVSGKMSITMDDSKIESRFDIASFAKPAIGFDIAIDTINIDRYISKDSPTTDTKGADSGQSGKETPINLSALKGFSLDGGVRIGTLQVHGIKAREIVCNVVLKNGQLAVAPLTAKLYDGTLDAKATINADTNQFAFSPKLSAIQVGPLLRDAAQLDKMEGKGDVFLDLMAQGNQISAIKKSLQGKASVRLGDGEIKGFDYGKRLAGWREKLTSLGSVGASNEGVASSTNEKTVFSELTATFSIDKGVATNNDLLVKAPLVRLGGNGSIDIGNDNLDYTVKASVVNTLTGQGGKSIDQTKDITIPVRVYGPFDKIVYSIQWVEVSSVALQSVVAPKIEEQKKILQDKVQDKLKGSLQGLFK